MPVPAAVHSQHAIVKLFRGRCVYGSFQANSRPPLRRPIESRHSEKRGLKSVAVTFRNFLIARIALLTICAVALCQL